MTGAQGAEPSGQTPNQCPACGNEVMLGAREFAGETPCLTCGRWLWFVRRTVGNVAVLTFLPGLIVGSESDGRVDEVLAALGDCSGLILNVSRLRLTSSIFLGMMVALHRTWQPVHGRLKVCGLGGNSRDALKVTHLDVLFDVYEDEQAALASFG